MAYREDRLQVVLPADISVERIYWLLVHEDLRQVARVDTVCKFLPRILSHDAELTMSD